MPEDAARTEPRTDATSALALALASDTLTPQLNHTWLDLIHNWIDLIHARLELTHTRLDFIHTRLDNNPTCLDLIHNWIDLIHARRELTHTRLDFIHTRLDNNPTCLDLIHNWINLIHHSARSHPLTIHLPHSPKLPYSHLFTVNSARKLLYMYCSSITVYSPWTD